MEPIAKLKKELEFNKNLGSLLGVIKTIAAMEYHAFRKKMRTFERFLKTIEEAFVMVSGRDFDHPFVRPATPAAGIVAITSDAGLLGGLNMQIIRAAIDEYSKNPGKLIIVGKKGELYMRSFNVPCAIFPGVTEATRLERAFQLRDYLTGQVLSGAFGHLKIIHPYAVSFVSQRVRSEEIFPFSRLPKSSDVKGKKSKDDIVIESPVDGLIEYLIYLWLGQRIFEIFGWSRLAELAARYNHLEGSVTRVNAINTKLKMRYHKVRHQLIDRTMCEVFAARAINE